MDDAATDAQAQLPGLLALERLVWQEEEEEEFICRRGGGGVGGDSSSVFTRLLSSSGKSGSSISSSGIKMSRILILVLKTQIFNRFGHAGRVGPRTLAC